MTKQRIIIGISGASGFMLAVYALKFLKPLPVEVHLVMTDAARLTCQQESTLSLEELYGLVDVVHDIHEVGASIASGSFQSMGMLVVPCSMGSLSAIAQGLSHNLLTRAADVTLKERRRLVLMTREAPLNLAHITNMKQVTLMGGIIFPPVPAFYRNPQSIDEVMMNVVLRALRLFDIQISDDYQWEGLKPNRE